MIVIFNKLFFTDPVDILEVNSFDQIDDFFSKLHKYLEKGYYSAGYFSYEFGMVFEKKLLNLYPDTTKNLACFGIFKKPVKYRPEFKNSNFKISNLKIKTPKEKYFQDLDKIKNYIKDGDIFQANYTTKLTFDFEGDLLDLYNWIRQAHPVPYSAYIKFKNKTILSFSPELFFEINQDKIKVKPMKGTLKRGKDKKEDEYNKNWLRSDIKNQSENIMILDLMRNDLSKIAKHGSVRVNSFFDIEEYKTLFQMTSEAGAVLKDNLSYNNIFSSLFPSGSVTGAPKIRAMEIIKELENDNRGVYCGSIGYFSPEKKLVFNVAIRTIEFDGAKGQMGIGSGIVDDSDPEAEYQETLLKAKFLININKDFKLIESLRWQKEYFLLDLHLARLKKSAEYFDFNYDTENIKKELNKITRALDKNKIYKIRLLMDYLGNLEISLQEIKDNPEKIKIKISDKIINSNDIFLYHKTTNRELYDKEPDCIFFNENGELTEGAIYNIFIEKHGILYTPPALCGLLAGVYRQYLIGNKDVIEKKIYKQELINADKIFLCNSVRGLMEAILV